jgi:hypothetical protein
MQMYLEESFRTMADRFAQQIANARAKRLMHGALGASNIAIDGRWVDFATMSTLSDYGRVIIARGLRDFMTEELGLYDALRDICYYANKYLNSPDDPVNITREFLVQYLQKKLAQCCEFEYLGLSGIPRAQLHQIAPTVRGAAADCFREVIRRGNLEPFKLLNPDPNYTPTMPSKMGAYSLNCILIILSLADSRSRADEQLFQLIGEESLRTRLVRTYFDLREAALALPTNDKKEILSAFICVNAIRMNTQFAELYRTQLNPEIESLVEKRGSISEFIAPLVNKAKTFLADENSGKIDLSWWFGKHATLSNTAGLEVGGRKIPLIEAFHVIRTHLSSQHTNYLEELCKRAS